MSDQPTAQPSLRAPRQTRSREAMRRIMDAAEQLLEDRAFDQISIAEIARQAQVTIGSLYLRFPNKQVLINAVHSRYSDECEAAIREVAEPSRWQGQSLEERVIGLAKFTVELYRTRRGVIRSLSMHYRLHPETASAELVDRNDSMYRNLERILLGAREEIAHPNPDFAAYFAVQLLSTTCRERILFPDYPADKRVGWSEGSLTDELERTALGYLTRA